MKSNHDRSSMPDKLNKQGRQTTDRESDCCIVPTKLEDQSSGQKPGSAGVGKAARQTRDRDRASSVLRDGTTVLTWLDRITRQGDERVRKVRFGHNIQCQRKVFCQLSFKRVTSVCWEPDALTAHVRICEGANSIVHGSNIVTPPEETGGKQGTQTVS